MWYDRKKNKGGESVRRVRCYECGRSYDYDEDGFCPRCGAFNLPGNSASIGADGSVVRHEGIRARNHEGSFLHEEYHEENRERRGTRLSQGVKRGARGMVTKSAAKSSPVMAVKIVFGAVLGIMAFNLLANLLVFFLYL